MAQSLFRNLNKRAIIHSCDRKENMGQSKTLIEDNISILGQGIEMIAKMGDHLYANEKPPYLKTGVGSHFRHCIDFYNSFLASLATGQINYVHRQRNPLVE